MDLTCPKIIYKCLYSSLFISNNISYQFRDIGYQANWIQIKYFILSMGCNIQKQQKEQPKKQIFTPALFVYDVDLMKFNRVPQLAPIVDSTLIKRRNLRSQSVATKSSQATAPWSQTI